MRHKIQKKQQINKRIDNYCIKNFAVLIYSTSSYFGYDFTGGTSVSAPMVSAVAALILSINPNFTNKQVRCIIETTAQKVGGYNYQTKAELLK